MKTFFRNCLLAVAAGALLACSGLAQERNIRSVIHLRVIPSRVGDFEAATKEWNEAAKKAGREVGHGVSVRLTGPREYAVVSSYAQYADLDKVSTPDAKITAVNARINSCIESADRSIHLVLPEFRISEGANAKMYRVARYQLKPEHEAAFLALMKNDRQPAVQKAGVKRDMMTRIALGGNRAEYQIITGVDSWADLNDTPARIRKGMGGDEKWAAYRKSLTALIVDEQVDVYRYMPELSYTPPPPTGSR